MKQVTRYASGAELACLLKDAGFRVLPAPYSLEPNGVTDGLIQLENNVHVGVPCGYVCPHVVVEGRTPELAWIMGNGCDSLEDLVADIKAAMAQGESWKPQGAASC